MSDPAIEPVPTPELQNPYAPPGATSNPEKPAIPSFGVYAFIGFQLVSLGSYAAAITDALPWSIVLVQGAAELGAAVVGLFWLQGQWGRLPARLQMVKGKGATPGEAAFRNLIPFYGLYWMFVVNGALCDGIDALLEKKRRDKAAPIWLATVCPLSVLAVRPVESLLYGAVSLCIFAVFAILWVAYMIRVEQTMFRAKQSRSE